MKKLIILSLLGICVTSFGQGKGTVKGLLTDKEMNNEPLPFANVYIKGTTIGSITDMDGVYSIDLSEGDYVLVFSFVGYQSVEKSIRIVSGKEVVVDYTMEANEGQVMEEVVINAAPVLKEKEGVLILEQKKATIIKESIGAVELSKKGVGDAAGATTKISGVVKSEGSGSLYIRGLGDRYLFTTMNGLPIPSDDINNKNINLNLFNTGIIQNVGISKTYSTDGYADQASGVVDVVSKSYTKKGFKVNFGTGSNTNVLSTGDLRSTIISDDVTLGFHKQKFTIYDAITHQGWDTKPNDLPINYKASLGFGHKIKIADRNLTVIGSCSYSTSTNYREGLFRSYSSNVLNNAFSSSEEFDTERFSNITNLIGYVKSSFKISDGNNIMFNSLFVNRATEVLYEQGRKGLGFVYDQDPAEYGAFIRDQNFKQTTLSVNQLYGNNQINQRNKLSWALGYSMALAKEPNRIRNEVNFLDLKRLLRVQFSHVGDFQQKKSSQNIFDKDYSAYVKVFSKLGSIDDQNKADFKLNYGLNFRKKARDFKSVLVGVKARGVTAPSVDQITTVFSQDNFISPTLQYKEPDNDLYTAKSFVKAGFVNFDFKVNKKVYGNVGFRLEKSDFNVSWDVANYRASNGTERTGELNNTYGGVYPSMSIKYLLTEKSTMRFASSLTQTLPEFKELSPFEYVSSTGRVSKGNPLLKRSNVYNTDLKWEFFPTNYELVSAALFYKQISNPINLILQRSSSGNFEYNNTGDKADVLGLEIEGKFTLLKDDNHKQILSTTANTTLMYLNQDLLDQFQYNGITHTKLQGASNFIANTSITYNSQTEKALISTLTANYSSDKIFALGSPNTQKDKHILFNDQIIEKGFVSLDLVLSKKVSKYLTAKLIGRNLLNPDVYQTQMIHDINSSDVVDQTVQLYKKGIQLSFGLSMSF